MPVDPNSTAYVNSIGATKALKADFGSGLYNGSPIGIPYVVVPQGQPKVGVTFTYDDESDPGPYPIPPNPPIEGGSDRHILIVEQGTCKLYELFAAYPNANGTWQAGSGAVFDLNSNALRPAGWTSADAAGFAILPGLVRREEVVAGEINHAIRFTAPQIRNQYIWPARHKVNNNSSTSLPPMGQRFRLKANFNIDGFSNDTKIILTALKKYGLFLADIGSSWFMSGAPDNGWNNDILREFNNVPGSAFEAVDISSLQQNPNSGQVGPTVKTSSGTPQTTITGTTFANPLQVSVRDLNNNPVSGVAVNFTAPTSGASGTFSGSVTNVNVTTDANGLATAPTFTANNTVGGYVVNASATISGFTYNLKFNLGNLQAGKLELLTSTVRIASTLPTDPAPLTKLTSTGTTPSNPPNSSAVALQIGGKSGIPANASGVTGILTNVGCSGGGNLRFWTGANVPNSVNLNIPGANSALNLSTNFIVPLDSTGKVNLGLASGATISCGFVVDITGYITPDSNGNIFLFPSAIRAAATNGSSAPENNAKLVSAGTTPPDTGSATVSITARGLNGIPNNANGIMGVLTNVGCNGGGNLRLWAGGTAPNTTNLNIPGAFPTLNMSTGFTVPLELNGTVKLGLASGATISCGYTFDLVGYITSSTQAGNVGLLAAGVRVAGTNGTTPPVNNPKLVANGLSPANPPANSTINLTIGNANGVPAGAKGVIGVLTNVGCSGGGNFRFWATGNAPNAANLNVPGANSALNLSTGFVAPLDANGKVNMGLASGATVSCGYVLDVTGFLS
jgi:hypothetical protein